MGSIHRRSIPGYLRHSPSSFIRSIPASSSRRWIATRMRAFSASLTIAESLHETPRQTTPRGRPDLSGAPSCSRRCPTARRTSAAGHRPSACIRSAAAFAPGPHAEHGVVDQTDPPEDIPAQDSSHSHGVDRRLRCGLGVCLLDIGSIGRPREQRHLRDVRVERNNNERRQRIGVTRLGLVAENRALRVVHRAERLERGAGFDGGL